MTDDWNPFGALFRAMANETRLLKAPPDALPPENERVSFTVVSKNYHEPCRWEQ